MAKTILPKEKWSGRFDESQYDLLIECSNKKDFSKWNEFREKLKEGEKILLEGANLSKADQWNTDLSIFYLAKFNLSEAHLYKANLSKANLWKADLSGANLQGANLSGVFLQNAKLKGTHAQGAIVDGRAQMFECFTDDETDFTGVGLGEARIDPQLKSTIEANIRRLWWNNSYYSWKRPFSTAFAWFFWWLSDYGRSTARLLISFCCFALFFAIIYASFPYTIAELITKDGESVNLFLRSLYLSVVTMTTLGFGDMHAAQGSIAGHILLMVHVIIGYVILAALVVRLGTLFTSVPPEHKKAPNEKK